MARRKHGRKVTEEKSSFAYTSEVIGLILIAPYRMDRITSFINPWSDPLGTGFQIIQIPKNRPTPAPARAALR